MQRRIAKIYQCLAFSCWIGFGISVPIAAAQVTNPSSYEKLRQDSTQLIRNKLEPLLTRYCGEACQVIRIEPEIQESVPEIEDLGFEGSAEDEAKNSFYVERAVINIQVDGRVTSQNRELLEKILINHLSSLGFAAKIEWVQIRLPRIGQSDATLGQLRSSIEAKLNRTIQKVIDGYCPDKCLVSQITIEGSLITPDEAEALPETEIVKDGDSLSYMHLKRAEVTVEVDSTLVPTERTKILNVMKANTRFANPVEILMNVIEFPESYASKQEKKAAESDDPYGLEKLRRTLILFRDLAGTKEIVTNSTTSQNSTASSQTSSTSASERNNDTSTRGDSGDGLIKGVPNWILALGGIAVVLLLVLGVVLKVTAANRDAKFMMYSAEAAPRRLSTDSGHDGENAQEHGMSGESPAPGTIGTKSEIAIKLKVDELKTEMIEIFLHSPRVAKETFSRMLSEEGVELTAKYVHIFGHLVVFELLGDPNLSRDLFDLSEYFHKSNYSFTLQDEWSLLMSLKTKVTANEIRVLARKTRDQFDFLLKLDPTQVYNLIIDEQSSIQSIVLTQLDHKKRRLVFDLYEGKNKVDLMRELCRADAIPKEYLANVAIALQKKIAAKPEFDTENLRSADILLDLLEKASLEEQKALMANLNATNHDAARALKLKLVTVEMLPYLKDGHLLELVLGLDRDDLMTFLAGSSQGIRDLLLSKAPEELAESWLEDLAHVAGVEESKYRLVEMKILGRIRNLANLGAINLLDINEMIFNQTSDGDEFGSSSQQVAPSHLVA